MLTLFTILLSGRSRSIGAKFRISSDTGFDHTVRDVLRGFSRNREDADVHAVVRDVVFKTVHPVGSDIRFSGDFFRIHVENRVDQDAVLPVMIVLCR